MTWRCVPVLFVAGLLAQSPVAGRQAGGAAAARVENLQVESVSGGVVDITYDLLSDNTRTTFDVSLRVSVDEQEFAAVSVSGDVGAGVLPGVGHRIRWAAGLDVERLAAERFVYDLVARAEALAVAGGIRDPLTGPGWTRAEYDTGTMGADEARALSQHCAWSFEPVGFTGSNDDRWNCPSPGGTSVDGPVRIEVQVAKRRGGRRAYAGILFGFQDWDNYFRLAVHPGFGDGDVGLSRVRQGRFASLTYSRLDEDDEREGGWALAVETSQRRLRWFVNDRMMGELTLDGAPAGQVRLLVGGDDDGTYVFRDLSIREPGT